MKKTDTSYLGNSKLKAKETVIDYTTDMLVEYVKCKKDIIYFIKTYCKIITLDEGLTSFELYPFQERAIKTIEKERFVIGKWARQSGKTSSIVCGWAIHKIIFEPHYSIGILANKGAVARGLLKKLKDTYENLPLFLQQGVAEWNKGSILLENGSRVLAAATSASSVRSESLNAILLDEYAFVPRNIADDFMASTYPVVTAGTNTKIIIYSTPSGLNHYYKLWMDAVNKKNGYIPISVHWSEVPGRGEKWKKQTIKNIGQDKFDQEYECIFAASSELSLIPPKYLTDLPVVDPIEKINDELEIYELPDENNNYVIVADTARGDGNDYSVFLVIDVSKTPYKIVAKYKSNTVAPSQYSEKILHAAELYNNAYVLIEINDTGGQVVDDLYLKWEYEYIFRVTTEKKIFGQVLCFDGVNAKMGVRTSEMVRRIGCMNLKGLFEAKNLILNDFDTISELSSFINVKGKYEAEAGANDDLVMCLVLFAWMTGQQLFRETYSVLGSMRTNMSAHRDQQAEDEVTPFGYVNDGTEDDDSIGQYDEEQWGLLGIDLSILGTKKKRSLST